MAWRGTSEGSQKTEQLASGLECGQRPSSWRKEKVGGGGVNTVLQGLSLLSHSQGRDFEWTREPGLDSCVMGSRGQKHALLSQIGYSELRGGGWGCGALTSFDPSCTVQYWPLEGVLNSYLQGLARLLNLGFFF